MRRGALRYTPALESATMSWTVSADAEVGNSASNKQSGSILRIEGLRAARCNLLATTRYL